MRLLERLKSPVLRHLAALSAASLAAFAIAPSAQAGPINTFERLKASPNDLTAVTINPSTQIIYAQENRGTRYYSYDPRTNEWTELAEAPINSGNNGGAAYLDGKIYTAFTGNAGHLGVYDIATNTWTEIANPLGHGTADITAVGNELYMVEGTSFVKYNPATEATTPLAEAPLFTGTYGEECDSQKAGFQPWGALVPYGGQIYGDEGDGGCGFASYDVATNTWTELPPLPEGAVAGAAIDPVTGTYYADGSYGEENFYRYSIASKTWTTVPMPFELADAGMAYVSLPGTLRGIYAIQGEEGRAFTRYATPGEVDLAVTATAPTSATLGGTSTYSFTVKNNGPEAAPNAVLTDALPQNGTLSEVTTTVGTCSAGTAFPSKAVTVSCNLGTLGPAASANVKVTLTAGAAGTLTDTASATSEYVDVSAANNTASASTDFLAPAPPSTPTSAPTPTPTPAAVPQLKLASLGKTLKGGKEAVKLACSEAPCSGVVTLTAKLKAKNGKQKLVTIGHASYSLASGATKTLKIKLSAKARKALKHGKLAVGVSATVTGGSTASGAVTLHAAKKHVTKHVKKHRKKK